MTQLDFLEALKAIRLCVQKPRYKVGIFTQSMREAECAYTDVVNAILEDDEEKRAVKRADTQLKSRIAFENGSIIQFVRASESARGCKFNHVLYGGNIAPDILANVVQHTEFRYENMKGIDKYEKDNEVRVFLQ